MDDTSKLWQFWKFIENRVKHSVSDKLRIAGRWASTRHLATKTLRTESWKVKNCHLTPISWWFDQLGQDTGANEDEPRHNRTQVFDEHAQTSITPMETHTNTHKREREQQGEGQHQLRTNQSTQKHANRPQTRQSQSKSCKSSSLLKKQTHTHS